MPSPRPAPVGKAASKAASKPAVVELEPKDGYRQYAVKPASGAIPPQQPELKAPPPSTTDPAERLARRWCEHAGMDPDAYFMGDRRWKRFHQEARRFLIGLDFIKELLENGE